MVGESLPTTALTESPPPFKTVALSLAVKPLAKQNRRSHNNNMYIVYKHKKRGREGERESESERGRGREGERERERERGGSTMPSAAL